MLRQTAVGPICGGDTFEYAAHSVVRSPLYPFVLDVFRLVFGAAGPFALVVFQVIIVLAAGFYLSAVLARLFKLPQWAFFVLCLVLTTPLIPSKTIYASVYGEIGNLLMTEAVSYSLFLFFFAFLAESVFSPERYALKAAMTAAAFLMVLARGHFLFTYVPLAALIAAQAGRNGLRKAVSAFALLLMSLLAANLVERVHNYYYNGIFVRPLQARAMILHTILYSAPRPDFGYIKDAGDSAALAAIYSEMEKQGTLAKQRGGREAAEFYGLTALKGHHALLNAFALEKRLSLDTPPGQLELEKFCGRALPEVLRRNWRAYFKLAAKKFLWVTEFREGLFAGLLIALFAVAAPAPLKTLLILAALAHAGNYALLSLSVAIITRYIFYTATLLQALIVVSLIMLWRERRAG